MTDVRIDQLTAHSESAAAPVSRTTILPVRDPTLSSDNTRRMLLSHIEPFTANILQFGADPTGIADSTAAIAAAIAYVSSDPRSVAGYLNAGNGMGTVFMPPGVYKISQIVLEEGISLIGCGTGRGGTFLYQPNGFNQSAIVQSAGTVAATYIHYTHLENFRLFKATGSGASGLPTTTDTLGSGIYLNSNCGETTKLCNLIVEGFPQHGIHITGAIPVALQDLTLHTNGVAGASVGYGLFLEQGGGHSFTGHYVIGVSGDNNRDALIGAKYCNVNIMGVKSETQFSGRQNYAIELTASGQTESATLIGITHSGSGTGAPVAVVHIADEAHLSGSAVWLQGVSLHNGATAPTYLILDSYASFWMGSTRSVPYSHFVTCTYYSSHVGNSDLGIQGAELLRLGPFGSRISGIGVDPEAIPGAFGIGYTNGDGTSGAANLQGKSGGATGPSSLTANKWVRANLNGVQGWVPFFT